MSHLGSHDYFGRALAVSLAVHASVVFVIFVRPMWQDSPAWQLPDAIDIGVVRAGDLAHLGGGAAADGAKQLAQEAATPPPAPAAAEPEPSETIQQVEAETEPDLVVLAPTPSKKASPTPKPSSKPKSEPTTKPKVTSKSPSKSTAPAKPVAEPKIAGKGAVDSRGTDPSAPAASAASALNSVLAKYQKPGGRGDGTGLGEHSTGRDGTASAGIASNFYQRTLVARIRQFWNVPPGIESEGLSTVFALTIRRDGALESANLVKSSGDRLFDASAEKAVHAAGPYGPVPQSIGAPFRVEVRLIPENKN